MTTSTNILIDKIKLLHHVLENIVTNIADIMEIPQKFLQTNGAKIILNLSLDISKYPALFWEVFVRNLQGFTENKCILRNIRNSKKNMYI